MWDIHRCYWAMSLTEVLSACQPMGVARYIKAIVSIVQDTYFRRVSASRDTWMETERALVTQWRKKVSRKGDLSLV